MPVLALVVIVVVGVALLLFAEKRDNQALKAVSKLSASTAFVAIALGLDGLSSGYGRAVVLALVLSWVGDACLLSMKKPVFMAGIFSFLLGHVGFCAAFLILGVTWPWVGGAALAVGAFAIAIDRWLTPQVEANFKIPVRAYISVIAVMASLAFGAFGAGHTWLIPVGAVAFFLSDITVALDRFVEEKWGNRLVGLPLYYGAQVLLAFSVAP